jgi:hypothetical protein
MAGETETETETETEVEVEIHHRLGEVSTVTHPPPSSPVSSVTAGTFTHTPCYW